ncbi:MAG: hypothetical protein OHK0046_31830 [Anaerolineae bacterium]
MKTILTSLILAAVLLAGCDSLAVVPPTLTPTREFSAPTLAPTRVPLIAIPTNPPPGVVEPGQSSLEVGDVPFEGEVPPVDVEGGDADFGLSRVRLTVREGVTVVGDLYENPPVQLEQGLITPRLPGVILLGVPTSAWGAFPQVLRDNGFTVLVVDMESGATDDFIAVLRALSETETVNPGLIAAIGVARGADLALVGCAAEPLCDALVLLSPLGQQTLLSVLPAYNPRPLLVYAAPGDQAAIDTAQALQGAATGRFDLETVEGAVRGVDLFTAQPGMVEQIITWLQSVLVVA